MHVSSSVERSGAVTGALSPVVVSECVSGVPPGVRDECIQLVAEGFSVLVGDDYVRDCVEAFPFSLDLVDLVEVCDGALTDTVVVGLENRFLAGSRWRSHGRPSAETAIVDLMPGSGRRRDVTRRTVYGRTDAVLGPTICTSSCEGGRVVTGDIWRQGVVAAHYEGACVTCRRPIERGQLIAQTPYSWVHQECFEATSVAIMSGRRKPDAPGYRVPCPKCGAAPGDYCVTDAGKKAPLHAGRRALIVGP